MPDASGWPTAYECLKKLDVVASDQVTANLLSECAPILAAVIAEFQSPTAPRDLGGTGRRFTPVTEVRTFDGTGYPNLFVDDIVPNTALSVLAYGNTLTDVLLHYNGATQRYNEIIRTQGVVGPGIAAFVASGIFPLGIQNVAITTTWGAAIPGDIYEAIRMEVGYLLLVNGVLGVNGVGEEVHIGDFETSTAVGAINWRLSSPVGVFHDRYRATIRRHRARVVPQVARIS